MGVARDTSARIAVRVTARAARETIGPWRVDRLEVRTTAPPVEDRANDAVCRLIAAQLGIAPSRVQVIRGRRGREKLVQISGLSAADVLHRLGYPDPA